MEETGFMAGCAVATVELLIGVRGAGASGRGGRHVRGFGGNCEEYGVLDGAAVAGAVEWAACWWWVAHRDTSGENP